MLITFAQFGPITMTSHERHGVLPETQLFFEQFAHANNKENIKTPCYWPSVRHPPVISNAETVSMAWHHVLPKKDQPLTFR